MEWWHVALALVAIIGITELIIKITSRLKPHKAVLSQPEFDTLPIPQQVAYIWANGKLVGSQPNQNHILIRYQLPNFYAEARYQAETDQIVSIRSFSNLPKSNIASKLVYSHQVN